KIHLAADEYPAAAGLLERAVALDKHDLVSRHQLAQAYEALGRRADAAEQRRLHEQTQRFLDELTRLNREATARPWDAAVRGCLAEVCQELGKADLAAMWRAAAGACPPALGVRSGEGKQTALKLLEGTWKVVVYENEAVDLSGADFVKDGKWKWTFKG